MYRKQNEGLFWRIFPWLFGIVFIVALVLIVSQLAVMGWLAYNVISDPTSGAQTLGNIISEVVEPIADAVKE